MRVFNIVILLLILQLKIAAQFKLVHEEIKKNIYRLTIEPGKLDYELKDVNGVKYIYMQNVFDESKTGQLNIPYKDFFIAVPQNSNPTVKISVTESEILNAHPQINPSVIRTSDSTLSYVEVSEVKLSTEEKFFVKGFLWVNRNYCLHISVPLFVYDRSKGFISIPKKILVELLFDIPLPELNLLTAAKNKNDFVVNSSFAEKFSAKESFDILPTDSWIDYSKTYLKIGTARDGIYRITKNDLLNLGIGVNIIDPRTFKMFLRGSEIPIFVEGETDESFDENDFIEFIGLRNMGGKHREENNFDEPYNEYLNLYSDTTIYWLAWGGADGERVMQRSDNTQSNSAGVIDYYNEVVHLETDNWFDFSMADIVKRESPFWIGNKTWVESQLGVGTKNINIHLSDVYKNKPAHFYAKLMDFASDIFYNAHYVGLGINSDTAIYNRTYIDKYQQKVLKAEISSNWLNDGNNTIKLHSMQTAAAINACAVDWYEIEYPRYLKPQNGRLTASFTFLSGRNVYQIEISDVTTDDYSLWILGNNSAKYSVQRLNEEIIFKDTLGADCKLFFAESAKVLSPKFFYVKQFVNLRSSANNTDYIAITNKKFMDKVNEYSQFISASYGLKTKVIDVDDIYDEFAYGTFSAEPIKDFLKATYTNWQSPRPNYVCLIGAATYDYHGNKNRNQGAPQTFNYVPSYGASASDNWFVAWDTTGAFMPQMNIGRVPVNTVEEFDWYFTKHREYINGLFDEWNKKFLFFTGGKGNDETQIAQFKSVNNFIIQNYVAPQPIGGMFNHFYKTVNPVTNFGPYSPQQFQQTLDEGSVFISYLGHSGTQTWDNSITEPSQLMNKSNRYPLITDFGCSTARFAEPDIKSFSQLFLLSQNGQAIAYVGNSSLGFLSTAITAPKLFYEQILDKGVTNICEALNRSKIELIKQYGSNTVNQLFTLTNTLIGDPVVRLPIPQKPNLNINSTGIVLSEQKPSSSEDSVEVKIKFVNLGKTEKSGFKIYIKDVHLNSILFEKTIEKNLPLNGDSIIVKLPVKERPGEHRLFVDLDNENAIDEIYESDNSTGFTFNVYNSSLRTNLNYEVENEIENELTILSPSEDQQSEKINILLSRTPDFPDHTNLNVSLDTFYTKIDLSDLQKGERYWLKTKLEDQSEYGAVKSFVVGSQKDFSISDNTSFASGEKQNVEYPGNALQLAKKKIDIRVFSAGYYDGKTAIISINNQNLIPENTINGHHVCLLDSKTYDFVQYKLFDFYSSENTTTEYIHFLDTLSAKFLVLIAVADEGSVGSTGLRNKIKSLGSKYIDSLTFRGSWAIIGRKGAAPGTVPENFSRPYEGSVELNLQPEIMNNTGCYITPSIGPAEKFNTAEIKENTPAGSEIKYRLLLQNISGDVDTTEYLSLSGGKIDLSFVDAPKYSTIKLFCEYTASPTGETPSLQTISVDYNSLAELGINYQTVAVDKDTLQQGETALLSFYVYNVGETSAEKFKITVETVRKDYSVENILTQTIDSLGKEMKIKIDVPINTNNDSDDTQFRIVIDADNIIHERYEDNNYYSADVFIKRDSSLPALDVKFDDVDISDGDFISPNPSIKIEVSDESILPVNDTSAVEIFLDNIRIDYFQNAKLSWSFSPANPKVIILYNAELEDGAHELKIIAKNIYNNELENVTLTKTFSVANDVQLLDVYNYPNPFANKTYFTFKLTQIPDELKIKIFTLAGRMIKEITKSSSELNYDFNRIYWNGRDEDGDLIANGVYLYKIILKKGSEIITAVQKLAVVR
ncbi:MAG: T9SS type A sorting domain-containing protein [Ignavibacteriales bacterium]|nr:T9SS type A sorting domain-containing protein [Ignavibacteriales bacterium]